MKCIVCKHGDTSEGTVTITLEKGNTTIVFKEVPAQICDNCGEQYIDETVTKELLKRAKEIADNGVEIEIRKYERAA